MKRILSITLIFALLCVFPFALAAPQESGTETYPTVIITGGWHKLVYDDEPGLEGQTAFDTEEMDLSTFSPLLDEILAALKTLDTNGIVDCVRDFLWELLGPVRMDENGESVAKVSDGKLYYAADNISQDTISCDLDWRLDPIENAGKLHKFLLYIVEERGTEQFHLKFSSASGAVLLAYLKNYGYDLLASVVFDISTHKGTSLFAGFAKRDITFDMEALGKLSLPSLSSIDLPALQPTLRILYESGLLDVFVKLLSFSSGPIKDRLYDEIIIPLIFTMPVFWSYIPAQDYEAAKEALLQGDPKYDNLVKKLDRYQEIRMQADEIVREAAKHVKVGVRASYGLPLVPLVWGAAVQADLLVDTAYASMGATCAPLDRPFGPLYRQKVCDGHNHISPDRLIDASTCLLPEQTWFSYKRPHMTDNDYSGWYDWFKKTDNPTVFDNALYPQYVEETEPYVFVPMVRESASALLESLLKAVGLYLLKIWRWLLLLPLDLAGKML